MPNTFDNSYARLPKRFFSAQAPTPVAAPALVMFNDALAAEIGVDLTLPEMAGNAVPEGAEPIATAYAGHQFGGWNPQLGDGRAVLLGEVIGPDGMRRDVQLKGSGQTMFSRNGDGRALIGAVLREYLVSEAMAALNIPTTRALAAVTTGEAILREGHQPGAVLTRIAQSHIRVGTFQFHYARRDVEALQILSDHVIERHYPEAANTENPVLAMLVAVVTRQAELVARWMHLGFIHGVMNTDNMAISGETIDYGPCAFMDNFQADKVFSSIDRQGRYAWNNQPKMAHWNLSQLAQALVPLLSPNTDEAAELAQAALDVFTDVFTDAYFGGFAQKLGITEPERDDHALINDLLGLMEANTVDFTLFFRNLGHDLPAARAMFAKGFSKWETRWQARSPDTALMQATNPVFIPRNHRIEEVVEAANSGNYVPFEKLHAILSRPFDLQPENTEYETPPQPDEVVQATFCGT